MPFRVFEANIYKYNFKQRITSWLLLFCPEPANEFSRTQHKLVVKVMSGKVAETVTKPSGKIKPSHHHIPGILRQKKKFLDSSHSPFVFSSLSSLNPLFHSPQMTKQNRMLLKKTHLKKLSSGSVFFYFIFFHLRVFLLLYILWADSNQKGILDSLRRTHGGIT